MRSTCLLAVILVFVITGCLPADYVPPTAVSQTVQAAVATAQAATRTPSPTPAWTLIPAVPTISPSPTATGTATGTSTLSRTPTASPVLTQTLTATPTQTPTGTPASAILSTTILSCDLGFDIAHGLGEVENAYVRVRNYGGTDLTNVVVILNASNEGKPHPDKSHLFASVRANYEVTTKLTVDTQSGSLSMLDVVTTSSQGFTTKVSGAGCRATDRTELDRITPILNTPRPIQGP
jgi:hypothetical protein